MTLLAQGIKNYFNEDNFIRPDNFQGSRAEQLHFYKGRSDKIIASSFYISGGKPQLEENDSERVLGEKSLVKKLKQLSQN